MKSPRILVVLLALTVAAIVGGPALAQEETPEKTDETPVEEATPAEDAKTEEPPAKKKAKA